jgi:hypothetical protein
MFQIILLICAAGVPPGECQPDQKALVVQTLGEERNELGCLRRGSLSAGADVVKPNEGEYEKIVCLRKPSETSAQDERLRTGLAAN